MNPQACLVIYDGDCGFCDRSISFVRRRLRPAQAGAIRFVPWQVADLTRYGLTTELADRSMWLIRPGRANSDGASAFAYLLKRSIGVWPWVARLVAAPLARSLAAFLYRLVAVNRHRLPGGSVCVRPTLGGTNLNG